MSVFVEWTRTVQDHFVRLQKLLGRGRELLINWEAPMASTFISSFSAQGVGEGQRVAGSWEKTVISAPTPSG